MGQIRESLLWMCCGYVLDPGKRPLVMGILNVTPDSFYDKGAFLARDVAITHALQMIDDGADIIDVGGESTRPGATTVPVEEELSRVIPVIESLARCRDIIISVDTTKAKVAKAAINAGACIINEVSACTHDDDMLEIIRASSAGVILMHMQGTPRTMQKDPYYENVVKDVHAYLKGRIDALICAGINRKQLAIDPGIGFGKSVEDNLALLRNLEELGKTRVPIVVGLSRKSFLGELTGREAGARLAGSLGGVACSVAHGAHIIRVHDVKSSRDAIQVAIAIEDGLNGQ